MVKIKIKDIFLFLNKFLPDGKEDWKIWESWATLNWSKESVGQEESRSQILNSKYRIPGHRSQTPNPESQILNPKSKFPDSKFKIHKKFGRNFVWPEKILGQKQIWPEKNLCEKNIWLNKYLGQKIFALVICQLQPFKKDSPVKRSLVT